MTHGGTAFHSRSIIFFLPFCCSPYNVTIQLLARMIFHQCSHWSCQYGANEVRRKTRKHTRHTHTQTHIAFPFVFPSSERCAEHPWKALWRECFCLSHASMYSFKSWATFYWQWSKSNWQLLFLTMFSANEVHMNSSPTFLLSWTSWNSKSSDELLSHSWAFLENEKKLSF